MQYVYNHVFKNKDMKNFSDIMTRFFLRNISFFHTMNRYNEIEYIQNSLVYPQEISSLPMDLQSQIYDILNHPNSRFLDVYQEISSTPTTDVSQKCEEIMGRLRSKD